MSENSKIEWTDNTFNPRSAVCRSGSISIKAALTPQHCSVT
ncbi:hypothetical protein SAMN05192544_104262 [Paraburkholderia hospita]|nr:hypothetical protein SAMN05192544_104262 [Paraburkholderia hospita]